MMFQFGIDTETGTRREMFDRFTTFGYENLQKGKHNVFMLDEAHLTEDDDIFEQLRLLLNLQFQGKRLISVLLLGQPELAKRLTALPQFEQRIDIRERIYPLEDGDVAAYIRHRLLVAGVTRDVFTAEAYARIGKRSQGVPRRINDIGEFCLVEACRSNAALIDESMVEKTPK
jgi:general secretion pathway protein A